MSTVAEQLREAREAANLTIEQIAEITKMRTDHVRALENGDYSTFSAPVYIRGFIRTYSKLLKLDVAKVMKDLDAEMGETVALYDNQNRPARSMGLVDMATLQLSKMDWRKGVVGIVAAVVLITVILSLMAWRKSSNQDPLKDLTPGIYKPARNTTETLPPPR